MIRALCLLCCFDKETRRENGVGGEMWYGVVFSIVQSSVGLASSLRRFVGVGGFVDIC